MLHQNRTAESAIRPLSREYKEALNVIAYRSVAVSPSSDSELQNLLKVSQVRNKALGLTGILLYDHGIFFQWLEGPQEGLKRVWSSIERDSRHRDITLLRNEPISNRVFDGWDLKLAKGGRVRVETAIASMDSREQLIQTLGNPESYLNLSLADVVRTRVLPRLAEVHRSNARMDAARSSTSTIWHASAGTGELLARLLVETGSNGTTEYIDSLLDQGASFNALYQEVLGPAQLHLGQLWDRQIFNDFSLSIGLARLQVELRRVNAVIQAPHVCRLKHSVLLSSQPEESHRIGLSMSSEVFDRGGWDVTCDHPRDDESLDELVHEQWFDVLQLCQSGAVRRDSRLASMRTTIDSARASSLNPSLIVVVDGRTFLERPDMYRAVHANAMSASALESITVAARLIQANRSVSTTLQPTPS